ncbi:MAG: hypothetical protein SF053_12600 [Bacteroidia bacterium]|nr:hypothetical protein [Bacteroidia bacterium]
MVELYPYHRLAVHFPDTFTPAELDTLASLDGKTLQKVIYTVWKNLTPGGGQFQALDWISLIWYDGARTDLHAVEDQPGIRIEPLNYGLEQTRVIQSLPGQVEMEQVDMTFSPVWMGLQGVSVTSIGLEEVDEDLFRNDVFHLEFEDTTIEISLGEAGMSARRLAV